MLFRDTPDTAEAPGRVAAVTGDGVILEASLFYPQGGGQPGDTGRLTRPGGAMTVADTRHGAEGTIVLIPAEGAEMPPEGAEVAQHLDWGRRHLHMRVHTALHLLSVVIPRPVTGGSIADGKGRLDFDMPEAPGDKPALEAELNALIARDLPVTTEWIDEAALDDRPELVKTMAVAPPRGEGRVRLVRIGAPDDTADLQPCGGTHVARTGEIGTITLGKIEKKGRQNRRVTLHLAAPDP